MRRQGKKRYFFLLEKWPDRLNFAGIQTDMQIDDLYELPSPDSGRAAERTERRPPDSVGVSRSAGGVRRGRNGTRCGKSISAEPSPSLQTAIFQLYSLPRQIITPAVAAPLADQSGQRGHCQQFHVVAQMALCGGTGNLLPHIQQQKLDGFCQVTNGGFR